MRRKITEQAIDAVDLPEITDNQRNFVFGILQGLSASDAYRNAYDCSGSADSTIWARASELKKNSKVAAWLSAARQAGYGTARLTLEQHLDELARLRELAIEKGNIGAAVQAENFRGKAGGHYTEKLEVSATDPMDALAELKRIDPEIAKQVAKSAGLEWREQETKH